jgi:hypothetical protein
MTRNELTDEWQQRGAKEGREYAILTNEINKGTFELTVAAYKSYKDLPARANLRDHMTVLELALLDPGVVVALRAVHRPDALDRALRVLDLIDPLFAHLREPLAERLGVRRGHGLHDAEQGRAVGGVGEAEAVVGPGELELDQLSNSRFAALLPHALLQLCPVRLWVLRGRENAQDVDNAVVPRVHVPDAAERRPLEEDHQLV